MLTIDKDHSFFKQMHRLTRDIRIKFGSEGMKYLDSVEFTVNTTIFSDGEKMMSFTDPIPKFKE